MAGKLKMIMKPLDNLKKYNIILASGSPRRRELLQMFDIPFKVATGIDVDESYPETLSCKEVPMYLSNLKAEAYLPTINENDLLITADTVVIVDEEVIGKPVNRKEAIDMLLKLSGRTHTVVSGVTIVTQSRRESFSAETYVKFSELTEAEIEYYVDKYKPYDKAGAYGIQEWIGAAGVAGIDGSFYNVMGLPVNRLYRLLQTF